MPNSAGVKNEGMPKGKVAPPAPVRRQSPLGRTGTLPFVMLALALLLRLRGGGFNDLMGKGSGLIVDGATGVAWSARDGKMALVGAGVRAKNLGVANVNVYSVALYMQGTAPVKKALRRDEGAKLHSALLDANAKKRLDLEFVRGVGIGKVIASLTAVDGVSKAALEQFGDALREALPAGVKRGEVLSLGWPRRGTLVLSYNKGVVGTFTMDAKLPRAVYALFLGGRKAVSPALKKSIDERRADTAKSMRR